MNDYEIGHVYEDKDGDRWEAEDDGLFPTWSGSGDYPRSPEYVEGNYGPLNLVSEVKKYDEDQLDRIAGRWAPFGSEDYFNLDVRDHHSPVALGSVLMQAPGDIRFLLDKVDDLEAKVRYLNIDLREETARADQWMSSADAANAVVEEVGAQRDRLEDVVSDANGKAARWMTEAENLQTRLETAENELEARKQDIERLMRPVRRNPQNLARSMVLEIPDDLYQRVADVNGGAEYLTKVLETFSEALRLLTKKSADYGPRNIADSPGGPLNGLLVRMWDKMARLSNLVYTDAEPQNEPIRDSFLDLLNYSAIALMVQDGHWPGVERKDAA